MKTVFSFLAIISVVLSAPTENIESRQQPFERCYCQLHTLKDGKHTQNRIFGFEVRNFREKVNECNTEALDSCFEVCGDKIADETQSLNLEAEVKFGRSKQEKLGQFLCDHAKRRIDHHQVGLEVHFQCHVNEDKNGEFENFEVTMPGQLHSRYDFSCVRHRGKYQYELGNLVEPTEAPIEPTTVASTTSPATTAPSTAAQTTSASSSSLPPPTVPNSTTSSSSEAPETTTHYTTPPPTITTTPELCTSTPSPPSTTQAVKSTN